MLRPFTERLLQLALLAYLTGIVLAVVLNAAYVGYALFGG
jgi:hypothetical protein